MPLKVNVGLSKKIGLPHYGSLGASCYVEVELDSTLLFADHEAFQERVKRAYVACHQAVSDEFLRQQNAGDLNALAAGNASGNSASGERYAANGNGESANGNASKNGGHQGSADHGREPSCASMKQLSYARQLAGKIPGLGYRGLESLVGTMFDKPLADLSSFEASSLIDTLKQVAAGSIELTSLQEGAPQ